MHPGYEHQAGTDFNMILLEALVLLRSAGLDLRRLAAHSTDISARTLKLNALDETKDYLRRRMLNSNFDLDDHKVLRGSDTIGDNTYNDETMHKVMTIQQFLFYGWVTDTAQETELLSSRTFPLFSVLVRFMVLSARIAQQMEDKDINEDWMRLACELMLHAALEALQGSDTLTNIGDITTDMPEPYAPVQPGILDCFAFRHLPDEAYNTDVLRYRTSPLADLSYSGRRACAPFDKPTKNEELAISEMFIGHSNEWDAMRHSYLSEFVLPQRSAMHSDGELNLADLVAHYQRRLPRLRQKYPYATTKAGLVECLESLWTINNSPGFTGKPVLMQIEAGGLEGLDDQEFRKFLLRVGLSSCDGTLKGG